MGNEPIAGYVFTEHAKLQMARRGIDEHIVREILRRPEQRLPVRSGRVVLQSRKKAEDTVCLIRVFVDTDRSPAEVVTVYRTSKVSKYWRHES